MCQNDLNYANTYGQMQERMNESIWKARLEIDKDYAKKANRDFISMQTYENKLKIVEDERERKKAQYDEVSVVEGSVQVTTQNLRNKAIPLIVTNIQYPVLGILKRISNDTDVAYRIGFMIGGCPKELYLNKEKAGGGAYLIRKFASEGAIFNTDTTARKKDYVQKLLAYLLNQNPSSYWIADDEGWCKFPEIGWQFVGGGEITWKKICKLCQ